MATRVVRSFKPKKDTLDGGRVIYDDFVSGDTHVRTFIPEIKHGVRMGLDSEICLGKGDLQKLGWPSRIKVVIYNLD